MKAQLVIALLFAVVAIAYSTPIQDEEYGLLDKLKLAEKYVKLIEKFGEKAWHFIECMGVDWAEHCVQPTLGCIAAKSIPGCIALIACEGKDAKDCAGKLN